MKYALGNMLNGAGGLNPDGLALDLQFAADKTLTARRGPTPIFTRGSGNNGGTTYFGPSSINAIFTFGGNNFNVNMSQFTLLNGRYRWENGDTLLSYTGTAWLLSQDGNTVATSALTSAWRPDLANWSGTGATVTTGNTFGIVKAADDEPRFDHDPANPSVCRGLLIEEGRTNLLNGSQTFATSGGSQNNWVDTNITRDGTLRTSPDGTANALRITASAANGTIISSAAAGSSAARVFSIFLRRVTGTGDIQYTLDNGSTWTTQSITGSWVRYTFAATTANQQVGIRIVTSGDAIEIWGAQLEAGSLATSYIPTTTGTAARAADTCNITGDDFTGIYNQPELTIFCEYYSNPASLGTAAIGLSNATSLERINVGHFTGPFRNMGFVVDDGTTQASPSFNANPNQLYKSALGAKINSFQLAVGGILATKDIIGTMPTLTLLNVGKDWNAVYHNNSIRSIRVYKKQLVDAKLQALTA